MKSAEEAKHLLAKRIVANCKLCDDNCIEAVKQAEIVIDEIFESLKDK